jgi:threonine synthase
MGTPTELRCIRCGEIAADEPLGGGCPTCAERGLAANLTTVYDLEDAATELTAARTAGVRWPERYSALLPVELDGPAGADAGPTPLFEAPELARAIGLDRLWIKDESRGLTWSFKDRPAAIAAAHARALGREFIVSASTGNGAAATAGHARRAGVGSVILFAQSVNPLMAAFGRSYGGTVVSVRSKEDRWRLMQEAVAELGWYPNSNYRTPPIGNNPWVIDGYKLIGFELHEQLGDRLPDQIFFPVCYGDALFGVWKACLELAGLGFVDRERLPLIAGGEIQGSLERALEAGAEQAERVEAPRETIAFSIAGPQSTYQALHATRASGGWVTQVSEAQLLEAQRLLAEHEGLYVETASAAALAALRIQLGQGRVTADAEVVLINSSTGIKSLGVTPFDGRPREVSGLTELVDAVEEQARAPSRGAEIGSRQGVG